MPDADPSPSPAAYAPKHKLRVVTATALFDGHDASIQIMRRILQSMGAEVIHLGHDRSVEEVVTAALQEDVQAIAISSYQGGHVEYFKYMLDLLRERGGEDIRIFGGGGGVITEAEAGELHDYGVARVFSPQDGQRLGLQGIVASMMALADRDLGASPPASLAPLGDPAPWHKHRALARCISALEHGTMPLPLVTELRSAAMTKKAPVLGITGTGGAGKSSLTDELIRRLRVDHADALSIAVLSVDPSRKKSGGALLGDRIRMNALGPWSSGLKVYMRSLATRGAGNELSTALPDAIAACKYAGFDVVVVETSGIGQGDAAIVPLVDASLYVMTPEYGAASQLEKIDMLDFADFVVLNKFDRRGALDALRDVRKQVQRNRQAFDRAPDTMPVFGTMAARWNDDGVTALYQALRSKLEQHGLAPGSRQLAPITTPYSTRRAHIVPEERVRYLADVARTVRAYKAYAFAQAGVARERQQLSATQAMLQHDHGETDARLQSLLEAREARLDQRSRELLLRWPELRKDHEASANGATGDYVSLAGTRVPKVALPRFEDHGELLRWLLLENTPGAFPFTAGVFPHKRAGEDPTRMFAGEGDAFRTNRRFKLLSEGMPSKRLSTAFDSVTLYGSDPAPQPDIHGKIGNSGVAIATLDDLAALYDGFDLCSPSTSVSMTINGPAPVLLAMFFNVAIDQRLHSFEQQEGRSASDSERTQLRDEALARVRGTVQADILKEDQGQNTCIFSTDFALALMSDVQQWFIDHGVRNFYSVSISGYHMAEAGANPITQLAFTLANGFTYVEAFLARGMRIDDFAPSLSFFFSSGMEPEYSVLGRVARRIWAVAMRDLYGASERSQKLKYHCQTSGRSLHAQEIAYNDVRTTLQALTATYDNANSLHTNAYDEAITTPTEESVRRALAIQLIVHREWGLAQNENPQQGSFIIEELTDLVEEAVLRELESLSERGGVLGAMELGYQRGKIQDESLQYEHRKHDGSYPIVGVNTFTRPAASVASVKPPELARSTDAEKQSQLARLADFHARHASESPEALERLRQAALANENLFAVLMDTVRSCSLGQITQALFEVGGRYRRNL
jgi:methylmalonyl-CoA mutase